MRVHVYCKPYALYTEHIIAMDVLECIINAILKTKILFASLIWVFSICIS